VGHQSRVSQKFSPACVAYRGIEKLIRERLLIVGKEIDYESLDRKIHIY
jgi:hypothetical protein